jgi:metallo-beta-lactamase family protein
MLARHHERMRLHFLGAARTVTGSQYLLETDRARVIIDCGMFQGSPHDVLRNRVPFAYDPKTIDAVLLTHAHLDHCGLIPHVSALGFHGPVYATRGTVELTRLVLLDSAKLQEEFAAKHQRFARKYPDRALIEDRSAAAELAAATDEDAEVATRDAAPEALTYLRQPLYTTPDATAALDRFKGIEYGTELEIAPGVTATYLDAGHILGSAIIRLRVQDGPDDPERIIVCSGDLGRPGTPILRDPTAMTDADYVLVESTYGGREHEPEDEAIRILAETIQLVADAKGVLLVPSFAIGRTQEVVWQLDRLIERGEIPLLPLYLDSPMASKASDVYRHHPDYYDEETAKLLREGDTPLDYPNQTITNDAKASRAIERAPRPYMIVASNGMLTGGRVVGHLRNLIDDPVATILFVGYQGEGTLGAHLQAGAKEVRLDGQTRTVRCQVRSISGFSAHADESELLDWLRRFTDGKHPGDPGYPRQVFIVHGDPEAQTALEPRIRELGLTTHVPHWHEHITLD